MNPEDFRSMMDTSIDVDYRYHARTVTEGGSGNYSAPTRPTNREVDPFDRDSEEYDDNALERLGVK
jgi:hypothetical protein